MEASLVWRAVLGAGTAFFSPFSSFCMASTCRRRSAIKLRCKALAFLTGSTIARASLRAKRAISDFSSFMTLDTACSLLRFASFNQQRNIDIAECCRRFKSHIASTWAAIRHSVLWLGFDPRPWAQGIFTRIRMRDRLGGNGRRHRSGRHRRRVRCLDCRGNGHGQVSRWHRSCVTRCLSCRFARGCLMDQPAYARVNRGSNCEKARKSIDTWPASFISP